MKELEKNKKRRKFPIKVITILIIISTMIIVNFDHIISLYESYEEAEVERQIHDKQNLELIEMVSKEPRENEAIESELEAAIDQEKLQTMQLHDMDRYRLYLLHAAKLKSKFALNIDYSENADYLLRSKDKYPENVRGALVELQAHGKKYLLDKPEGEYQKVELDGNIVQRISGKIVHIWQEDPEYKEMMKAAAHLKSSADVVEGYFYSQEFLKNYLNYD